MPKSSSPRILLALVALLALAVAIVSVPSLRHRVSSLLPPDRLAQLNALRFGYHLDRDVRIAMPDGVRLAASVFVPRTGEEKLATIFVREPYHRWEYGEGLIAAEYFARRGYAVVIEDLRGTGDSGGEFMPYAHVTDDGAATLDWIVAQPWSNGRVGTLGCSSLGETQYMLERAHHGALRTMVPTGAGGAIGSAAGRFSYFGLYEGGVFELASGFGWFLEHGAKDPHAPPAQPFDVAATLRELPVAKLVERRRPAPNGYDDFLRLPLQSPAWRDLGYLDDADVPRVPTFEITTWGDQTVGDTLAFSASLPAKYAALGLAPPERHLVVAPGVHCHFTDAGETSRFGDMVVEHAAQPYFEWYERWFDHWLRDKGDGLRDLPAVLYYMLGEQRWLEAPAWPPPEMRTARWYLDGEGRANGVHGDGRLSPEPPAAAASDEFVDDPSNPVPSRGGPVCCTGSDADRAGPVDQRDVESREDVLVYTSPVLQAPLRLAGPLRAALRLSSSAPDTDIVARLVDVWPDGHATNIQEGALRARYRDGFDRARPLVPNESSELAVDMRAIAYSLPAGHRLRLDIAGSSFPRLERNLHSGGDNDSESRIVPARNRVHHGGTTLSWIELPVLPPASGPSTTPTRATGS